MCFRFSSLLLPSSLTSVTPRKLSSKVNDLNPFSLRLVFVVIRFFSLSALLLSEYLEKSKENKGKNDKEVRKEGSFFFLLFSLSPPLIDLCFLSLETR